MGILQARILEWFIHRGWEKQLLLSRQFDVVQLSSRVQLFMTPWTAACQPSLSFTISLSLLKLMFIELVMPFNRLILCHPLLRAVFPSIRVISKELGFSYQVAKVLELHLQHQSFQ